MSLCICMYTYMYIYTYVHIYMSLLNTANAALLPLPVSHRNVLCQMGVCIYIHTHINDSWNTYESVMAHE